MNTQHATVPAPMAAHRWLSSRNLLPALALLSVAAGLAWFAADYAGRDQDPAVTAVPSTYLDDLQANIAFFEDRVKETKDHLSYDRLTGLYLQRLRETGDVADVKRAETSALASLDAPTI